MTEIILFRKRRGRFPSRVRGGEAFTLIEMLVVIATAVILIALAAPAINSVFSATSVTSAANQIVSTLTLARQYAITHNRNVGVYFFKYASTVNNLPTAYRGMQAWELNISSTATAGTATLIATAPVTKFASLGPRTVLNENSNFSTILSTTYNPNGASVAPLPPVTIPGIGSPLTYMAFLFRSDGSTSLPLISGTTTSTSITDTSGSASTGNGSFYWSLTVCDSAPYQSSPTTLPADFATVQLDAVGGTARLLRP